MRIATSPLPFLIALGTSWALVACTPVSIPVRLQAPSEAPGDAGVGPGARIAHGTIQLTILWPERPYDIQAIPLRTNSLSVQVLDASNQPLASTLLTRPSGGSVPTTANLSVPAGPNRLLIVKAFQEESPGFDSVPIAQGSASLTVQPSTEVTADLALAPAEMPAIATMSLNAGPLASITLTGTGFEGYGRPVAVCFGSVPSPYVTGNATQLVAVVPSNAEDGPLTVTADGLTTTSTWRFTLIHHLGLTPQTAVASAGQAIDFGVNATDLSNVSIVDPTISWSFNQTFPLLPPSGAPPSTLLNGRFTPGSTGSYEVRVTAGALSATASVTVN